MNKIEVECSDAKGLQQVIEYVYCGKIKICEENVACVLQLSTLFALPNLKSSCISFLQQNLCVENCLFFYNICKGFQVGVIENSAVHLIARNLSDVVVLNQLKHLSEAAFLDLLKLSSLPWTFELKIRAINTWLCSKPNFCSFNAFKPLLECTRLSREDVASFVNELRSDFLQWLQNQKILANSKPDSEEADLYNDNQSWSSQEDVSRVRKKEKSSCVSTNHIRSSRRRKVF